MCVCVYVCVRVCSTTSRARRKIVCNLSLTLASVKKNLKDVGDSKYETKEFCEMGKTHLSVTSEVFVLIVVVAVIVVFVVLFVSVVAIVVESMLLLW